MLKFKRIRLMTERAFLRFGSNVPMVCGSTRLRVPAIVERRHGSGNFNRFTDYSDMVLKQFGQVTDNQLLVITPYVEELHGEDASERTLRMIWRGRSYDCLFDSAVIVGDVPIYVWHIFTPVSDVRDDYDAVG